MQFLKRIDGPTLFFAVFGTVGAIYVGKIIYECVKHLSM